MILTADEVVRALKGSFRLLRREHDGFRAFDTSFEGFWRSFAAMILTLPAFIVLLAERRLEAGLVLADSGLFDDTALVAREALVFVVPWIAFPLVMIGFVRIMHLEQRYVGYIVAYNWSGVIASVVFAGPAMLHVLGLATAAHAIFYTFASCIILVQYRWFLARAALGVSGGLAAAIVAIDITVDLGVTSALRLLVT
jgi:hypothetical protein